MTYPRRAPVLLLLLVQVIVALLVALTVSSVVQIALPDGWPFAVRFWLPALFLAGVLFAGQVWAFAAVRRPPPD